jgi:hypothetical protein
MSVGTTHVGQDNGRHAWYPVGRGIERRFVVAETPHGSSSVKTTGRTFSHQDLGNEEPALLAKRIRFWQKERGDGQTGSPSAGSVGEAIVFAVLLLVGFFALSGLLASRLTDVPGLSSIAVGSRYWTSLLVVTSMFVMGVVGLFWTVFSVTTSAERRRSIVDNAIVDGAGVLGSNRTPGPSPQDFPTIPPGGNLYNSPGTQLAYRLPQVSTPAWSLLGLALFCLLWLGALAILLVVVTNSFFSAQPRWVLLVLTCIFAAVTVRVIQSFLLKLRETIRIGPTHVEVSDLPLYPGQRYEVSVFQAGKMKLASLKLSLVCEEHATYQEGTNLRNEVRKVHEQEILLNDPVEVTPQSPFSHVCEFVVSDNVMHSFQSSSNSVRWNIVLQGEMIRGSTFQRDFPVLVFPRIPHTIG